MLSVGCSVEVKISLLGLQLDPLPRSTTLLWSIIPSEISMKMNYYETERTSGRLSSPPAQVCARCCSIQFWSHVSQVLFSQTLAVVHDGRKRSSAAKLWVLFGARRPLVRGHGLLRRSWRPRTIQALIIHWFKRTVRFPNTLIAQSKIVNESRLRAALTTEHHGQALCNKWSSLVPTAKI